MPAEKSALDGALDSQQVDRAQRHGQQDAHDHADGHDQEEIGNIAM